MTSIITVWILLWAWRDFSRGKTRLQVSHRIELPDEDPSMMRWFITSALGRPRLRLASCWFRLATLLISSPSSMHGVWWLIKDSSSSILHLLGVSKLCSSTSSMISTPSWVSQVINIEIITFLRKLIKSAQLTSETHNSVGVCFPSNFFPLVWKTRRCRGNLESKANKFVMKM